MIELKDFRDKLESPGGKRPGGPHPCVLVILGEKAQSLERRIIEVQVVCNEKIKMGHGF